MVPTDLGRLAFLDGFDWDESNHAKGHDRHGVTAPEVEVEEASANWPLLTTDDENHSLAQRRLYALGNTSVGQRLFVLFTSKSSTARCRSVASIE